jgi:hypothetical protein
LESSPIVGPKRRYVDKEYEGDKSEKRRKERRRRRSSSINSLQSLEKLDNMGGNIHSRSGSRSRSLNSLRGGDENFPKGGYGVGKKYPEDQYNKNRGNYYEKKPFYEPRKYQPQDNYTGGYNKYKDNRNYNQNRRTYFNHNFMNKNEYMKKPYYKNYHYNRYDYYRSKSRSKSPKFFDNRNESIKEFLNLKKEEIENPMFNIQTEVKKEAEVQKTLELKSTLKKPTF